MIRLIFAQLLHWITRPNSENDEFRLIGLRVLLEWNAGFPCERGEKPIFRSYKAGFFVSLQRNAEASVDDELPIARHDMRRHRHQREQAGSLSTEFWNLSNQAD